MISNGVINELLPRSIVYHYRVLSTSGVGRFNLFDRMAIVQHAGSVFFIENDTDAINILNNVSVSNTPVSVLAMRKVFAFSEMRGAPIASPEMFRGIRVVFVIR